MTFNPLDANHKKICLRLLLVGVASGISAMPTSIRMCPPLTTKNWPYYTPVVAVGMSPCVCNIVIYVCIYLPISM